MLMISPDMMLTMIPKGGYKYISRNLPEGSVGHIQHVGYKNRTFPIHPDTCRPYDINPDTSTGTSRYPDVNILIHYFLTTSSPPKRKVVSLRLDNKKTQQLTTLFMKQKHGLIHHKSASSTTKTNCIDADCP